MMVMCVLPFETPEMALFLKERSTGGERNDDRGHEKPRHRASDRQVPLYLSRTAKIGTITVMISIK